jgi:hypothetical protein
MIKHDEGAVTVKKFDGIEFSIGGVVIELSDGRVRIWNGIGEVSDTPDVDLPIESLKQALSTTWMLVRKAE